MTSKLAKNLWIAPLKYDENEDVVLQMKCTLRFWMSFIRACDVQIMDVEWKYKRYSQLIQMIVVKFISLYRKNSSISLPGASFSSYNINEMQMYKQ